MGSRTSSGGGAPGRKGVVWPWAGRSDADQRPSVLRCPQALQPVLGQRARLTVRSAGQPPGGQPREMVKVGEDQLSPRCQPPRTAYCFPRETNVKSSTLLSLK